MSKPPRTIPETLQALREGAVRQVWGFGPRVYWTTETAEKLETLARVAEALARIEEAAEFLGLGEEIENREEGEEGCAD